MKKLYVIVFMLVALTTVNAQSNFSVGLVGTRFANTDNDNKLTETDNPFGYGVILGYAVNEQVTIALTGEYFEEDLESSAGKETDYRTHLSAYYLIENFAGIYPYLSSGVVYTHRKIDFGSTTKNDDLFNARLGAGLDYHIISNVNLNVDFGFYTDGLDFVGWTSSLGLRYGINL
jgi:outer membrane protein W